MDGVLTEPGPGALMASLGPQWVELEVFFWIDVFNKRTELGRIRNEVIERSRRMLMDNDFIVSANVVNKYALGGFAPLEVQASVKP